MHSCKWSLISENLMPCLFSFLPKGHYSVKKAAAILGIGTDNVIEVKCDERYVSNTFSKIVIIIMLHRLKSYFLFQFLEGILSPFQ